MIDIESIDELSEDIKNSIKEKTADFLIDIGGRSNINGYKYLIEAMIIKSEVADITMNDIYSLIQLRYHTDKSASVERCIRHYIQTYIEKADPDKIKIYLRGTTRFNNANIISLMHEYIVKQIEK